MKEIKKGDIVSRNSYGNDIIFSVKRILKLANNKKIAILKGIDVRVEADAPIEDLKLVSNDERERREKALEEKIMDRIMADERMTIENRRKEVIYNGKILHLDGDSCLDNKDSLFTLNI